MRQSIAKMAVGLALAAVAAAGYFSDRFAPQESAPAIGPDEARAQPPQSERLQRIERAIERARTELARAAEEGQAEYGQMPNPTWIAAQDRLAATLQAELGPRDYEWMLYLQKIPNRLAITAVPEDPTLSAGLLPGDVWFSVGPHRIFTPGDLRRALQQVKPGTAFPARVARMTVWVDVMLNAPPLTATGFRFEARVEPPEDASGPTASLPNHGR